MKSNTRQGDNSSPHLLQARLGKAGKARHTAGICLLALGLGLTAGAEGLRTIPPGAFDLGRSGGRFAHVDDASAVWNNPANLVEATNVQTEIVAAPIYMSIDHTSAGGEVESKNPWKFLADAFLVIPLDEGNYAAGLGVTMPYGLGVEWDHASPASPFYYTAPYKSGMTAVNINPTFGARLLDNLSIGMGLDVLWSELDIRQFYLWNSWPDILSPTPVTGDSRLKGDGWGWGGTSP